MPILSLFRAAMAALFLAAAATVAGPAAAQKTPVDLELVIAVDVSGSVDPEEAALQRDGYLKALVHPQVIAAITGGERKKIALTYFEWAGYHYQRLIVDWAVISGPASAEAFAAQIAAQPISIERWTSISGAIDYALKRFSVSPYRGSRRVLDISGDGRNNNGRDIADARAEALAQGITINGLPILLSPTPTMGPLGPVSLQDYYEDCVIGGPMAFVVPVQSLQDVAPAIRRKLILEIAAVVPQVVPVAERQLDGPKVDCLLAEAEAP